MAAHPSPEAHYRRVLARHTTRDDPTHGRGNTSPSLSFGSRWRFMVAWPGSRAGQQAVVR